jgi:predicted porin
VQLRLLDGRGERAVELLQYRGWVDPVQRAQKTELTRNMFGVGVTWDAGPGQIYFRLCVGAGRQGIGSHRGCNNGTVACARIGGLAAGSDGGSSQYEISYTYPLSKRTSVWVGYNKIANEAQAAYNFGVNNYTIAIGGRPSVSRSVRGTTSKSTQFTRLARGCKIDGRLRAPVFLSGPGSRHSDIIEAEDFDARDAIRGRRSICAQRRVVSCANRERHALRPAQPRRRSRQRQSRRNGCPDNCPNPSQYRVSSNASMFGIRGSEPLGGGVNAIFQVESKLFLDTGGGILAGRESFLGFQSPWGTLKLGFFLLAYDDIQPIFGNAPTLTTSILSTGALWAQAYLGPALAGGFDGRLANSVRYDLPTLAGFNGSIQYSSAEGAPTTNSGIVSAGGFYNNGPVQLGAAYELASQYPRHVDAPLSDTAFSIAGGYQFEGRSASAASTSGCATTSRRRPISRATSTASV